MEGQSSSEQQKQSKSLPKVRSKISLFSSIKYFFKKIFGKHNKAHYLKSLNKLVEICAQNSFISSEEHKMISNIVKMDDIKVSDVMIQRTDIIAMSKDSGLSQIKEMIIDKEHTRMPIFGENLDDIIGFIHSKDLVKFISNESQDFDINSLIRKIIYVPHSMRIVDLLRKMRFSRVHIAIVLDEYGGTDGLITIEDIMEEIVGEIEDEHDIPDNNIYNTVEKISSNILQIGGRVEIQTVENLLSQKIVQDRSYDIETIGGFILSQMKKVPQSGEVFNLDSNLTFKILEADLRSIKLVEITKNDDSIQE